MNAERSAEIPVEFAPPAAAGSRPRLKLWILGFEREEEHEAYDEVHVWVFRLFLVDGDVCAVCMIFETLNLGELFIVDFLIFLITGFMAVSFKRLESCVLGSVEAGLWRQVVCCYSTLRERGNRHPNGFDSAFDSGRRAGGLRRDDFGGSEGGYEKGKKMGSDSLKNMKFRGGVSSQEAPSFDQLDECEETDEEEGRADDDGGSDEEFAVLDSYRKRQVHREEVRRPEGSEGDLRHPLVKEICRLIGFRSQWNAKHESDLKHLLRSLKPNLVCAVLRSQSDERVALKFFYWADRQWRYRHYPVVYYAMLEVLSKTKMCQGARRVLRLMARRRIVCQPEAFGYLMVSYSRAGMLRHSLRVLTMMQKAGIELDLSICNTAVYVLVRANRLDKALRFVERMNVVGLTPDVVTYNCLIKGHCDVHRVDDASQLISEMSVKGCLPDKVSYYTVMGFLGKENKVDEVRDLMKKMMNESNLIPNQVTYNLLIHAFSKHSHAVEALEFVTEAEGKGFKVDKVGYSAVVHSFCQKGQLDDAKEVVNRMFSVGCIPDVVTYTTVVDGYCRSGDVDRAKKMLQQMYKHGCKPNTVTYTALLTGLCKNGNSSEAREMINLSEEQWWKPNAITYGVVMHGFRKEGKLSDACNVVREMIKMGFYPNPVEINLLIQSLCKEGKAVEAKQFMEECLHKGCAVNVVNFTSVIHGFCQKNDLEAALSLLDDMYLSSKHPDAFTYTTLVDALGKNGRIDEATELMKKMLGRGLLPTPVTYRTVIHRYCQMNKVEDLLKLLEKMLARQEHRTVYNEVIEKLCSFGNVEEAYKLLSRVLRTASLIDAKTCHVLMESYLRKGLPLSAFNVASRMFYRNMIPDLKLCQKVSKKLVLDKKVEKADKLMMHFVERGHKAPYCQPQAL